MPRPLAPVLVSARALVARAPVARALVAFALFALLAPLPAHGAGPVGLSGWTEQRFSLFAPARFRQQGDRVAVTAESAVSLIWRALPESFWQGRRASWYWEVVQGVPPTDLTARGGDDRNLALYFVFMPEEVAARVIARPNLRRLLNEERARVLVYVWGGDAARGAVLPSAYLGPRGRSVVLRSPAPGRFAETVDLSADYRRAFGAEPEALVGLAISADSDDTGSRIEAALSGLRID